MRWIQRLFNPKGALPVIALQVGANPVKREESVLNAAATQDCLPRKRVKLGREMYTICGIAEKDSYFEVLCDDFEPEFSRIGSQFIRDDYVCIDIGANIGIKSLHMAQLAPRGMVIAIEPSPTAFKCLQENVRISGHTNIVCVSCAIGTEEGSANFVDSSAYGYLSDEGSTKVELRTLASIVDQLSLHRIDFVKIDVEGTEDRILKHSFDLTNSFGSLLMFEMNTWCMLAFYNANPRSFLEWTLRSYAHILMVCPVGSDLLRKVAPSDLLPTLHTHLIEQRCITDFLVTNDGTRLLTPAQGLEVEVRSALT